MSSARTAAAHLSKISRIAVSLFVSSPATVSASDNFDVREGRWLEIFRAHHECGATSESELKYDRHLRDLCGGRKKRYDATNSLVRENIEEKIENATTVLSG